MKNQSLLVVSFLLYKNAVGACCAKYASLSDEEVETLNVFQRNTSTFGNRKQRFVGNVEFDTNLVGESLVEAANQCTATSKVDAVLNDVGI